MDKGGDRHLSIQFLIFDCYCDFLNVSRIVPLWEYRRTRPSEKAKRKKKKVSSSLLILSLYYIMCNSAALFFSLLLLFFLMCASRIMLAASLYVDRCFSPRFTDQWYTVYIQLGKDSLTQTGRMKREIERGVSVSFFISLSLSFSVCCCMCTWGWEIW